MRNKHVRCKRVFRRGEEPKLIDKTLEEALDTNELCRHILAVVERLDLSSLKALYDDKGGVPYPPERMLASMCLALIEGDRSSRVIQRRCQYDIRYKFLMGGLVPSDRTICRFRSKLEPILPDLLTEIVKELRRMGIVRGNLVAVDGTKIEGNVDQWKKVLRCVDEEDKESGLSDPDARYMHTRRRFLRGFNAQLGVDVDSLAVVAADVTNKTSDTENLPSLIEQAETNLGVVPDAVVADAGYDSAHNVAALEEKGIRSYIRPKDDAAEFWTVNENGCLACPAGRCLRYRDTYTNHGNHLDRYYIRECKHCERKEGCHDGKFKYITILSGMDPKIRVQNSNRCHSSEGQEALERRGTTIEGLFGHFKWNLRHGRFLRRGLKNVRSELLLLAISHNIRLAAGHTLRHFARICVRFSGCRVLLRPVVAQ